MPRQGDKKKQMLSVKRRARANQDIDSHFDYLDKEAGSAVAKHFLECCEAAFAQLAQYPQIGEPTKAVSQRLRGLRRWRVKDFESYLVYYLPKPDGVEIVHIRHSSRDVWGMVRKD